MPRALWGLIILIWDSYNMLPGNRNIFGKWCFRTLRRSEKVNQLGDHNQSTGKWMTTQKSWLYDEIGRMKHGKWWIKSALLNGALLYSHSAALAPCMRVLFDLEFSKAESSSNISSDCVSIGVLLWQYTSAFKPANGAWVGGEGWCEQGLWGCCCVM